MPNTKPLRDYRKARGLCTECGKPAVFLRTLCEYHLAYRRRTNKKARDNGRNTHRCIECFIPLHPIMDEGYVKCIQCRSPRSFYNMGTGINIRDLKRAYLRYKEKQNENN